jgi:hypothetical protein
MIDIRSYVYVIHSSRIALVLVLYDEPGERSTGKIHTRTPHFFRRIARVHTPTWPKDDRLIL